MSLPLPHAESVSLLAMSKEMSPTCLAVSALREIAAPEIGWQTLRECLTSSDKLKLTTTEKDSRGDIL